jgi:hypothetical protein
MRLALSVVAPMLTPGLLAACDWQQSICDYAAQFRVAGVVYGDSPEPISSALLDESIGTVVRPAGADGCEPFTLVDGEGLLGPNSEIYTVKDVSPATALAVVDPAGDHPVLYRAMPPTP